ncbi:MAG: toprim domain-containing protein [Lachnospiraceae bacterium]|nr:toprim domain-containing protein [Ruminococcus sp.]MCM1276717.1 toprim domain-containing protein [Lachnospiraceae bacterium]
MPYINFSQDDLYRANTADLVSFLQSHGGNVKKVGSTYKYIYTDGSGTHDSVTIHGGKWYDHKNQRGGYAVKFLQEFLGFSFQNSVIELLGGHCSAQTIRSAPRETPKTVQKPFELPTPNSDMRRVFAYLTKQRFIDPQIITHFAHEHKIYEDGKYHNVVFVGTDENGTPKQASVRSTLSFGKTFRITVAGSDTKYSFSYFGNDEKLFVFEAPIDMLSFITLYQKDWQQHSYIAMNGVYESAVLKALESHSELRQICLCTDNDEGGIEAAERLRDIFAEKGYTEIFRIAPQQKDWNEALKQRNGAEYLPAAPHERKNLYLQSVAELNEMRINPNRISNDLIAAYNSADRTRLAEFSLAASEHFLKIVGEDFPLDRMKNRLFAEYKCYLDKGTTATKLGKLQNAMTVGLEQLQKPSQTAAELKITARKLYDIADCALRLSAEETLAQRAEQQETSEEIPSDEPLLMSASM